MKYCLPWAEGGHRTVHPHKHGPAMRFHMSQTLCVEMQFLLSSSLSGRKRAMYGSPCVSLSSSSSAFVVPGGTICLVLPVLRRCAFTWTQFSRLFSSLYPGTASSPEYSMSRSINLIVRYNHTRLSLLVDSFRRNNSSSRDPRNLCPQQVPLLVLIERV